MIYRTEYPTGLFGVLKKCAILLLLLAPHACSDTPEPYPDVITVFADVRSNAAGDLVDFTTDDGVCLLISNTNIAQHRPDTVYRAVVGYVPDEATDPTSGVSWTATVYSLTGAQLLSDSTAVLRHDAIDAECVWAQGQYINLQLTAKTQGAARHCFGFATDSLTTNATVSPTFTHHHISIHHRQGNDPLSFSQTYYCSIRPSSLPAYLPGDSITVSVHTFSGIRSWSF